MSEHGELKRIGAKPHKNSGRGMVKGDGSLDRYVVDVKEYSKSFSVNKDVWGKIVTDTLRVDPNKSPVIMLVLGETKKTRLAIIEWNEFEELREIRENNERKHD
jgi:stalled ribosome rescue protein Dom34